MWGIRSIWIFFEYNIVYMLIAGMFTRLSSWNNGVNWLYTVVTVCVTVLFLNMPVATAMHSYVIRLKTSKFFLLGGWGPLGLCPCGPCLNPGLCEVVTVAPEKILSTRPRHSFLCIWRFLPLALKRRKVKILVAGATQQVSINTLCTMLHTLLKHKKPQEHHSLINWHWRVTTNNHCP
jgi:hypothetical protein